MPRPNPQPSAVDDQTNGAAVFWCNKCVMPSTRPRITFNQEGVCNACVHAENKKKSIDWARRKTELHALCDKYRRQDGYFDVLVPGSGGKDSVYVAWKLKHEFGMHPLCVTMSPALPTEIGKQNLTKFIQAGFDHLLVTPNRIATRKLSRLGLVQQGRPSMPATVGFQTISIHIASKHHLPLIMYGEEGETEYGGVSTLSEKAQKDRKTLVEIYFSGHDPNKYVGQAGIAEKDIYWWTLPSQEELDRAGIAFSFWSYFELWDPYEHYLYAKDKCSLLALPTRSIGTYTNFAQLDDKMQDLHVYLMYLKFGFGRASSDAGIDIRRGALDRKQGLALVNRYDGEYPGELVSSYLDYFEMTQSEFDRVLDSHVNQQLFKKVDGRWQPTFAPR